MTVRKGKLVSDDIYVKQYSCAEEHRHILKFTDTFYRSGSRSRPEIESKGAMNSAVAAVLYRYLASYRVRTCFVDSNKADELLVEDSEPLSLAAKIWNSADEDFADRYELKKGDILDIPVLELYYINKKGKMIPAPADLFLVRASVDAADLSDIETMSRKCNTVLRAFFERRGFMLLDCTLFWGIGAEGPQLCGGVEFEHLSLAALPETEKSGITPIVFGKDADVYHLVHDAVVA